VALELRGITKEFPTVLANDDVSLSVESGEIVALLGENGAGKTTLMNVLFGLYSPESGEIVIDGAPLELANPSASIQAGVGMVHQHFMLVPVFSVAENVILGMEPLKALDWIDRETADSMVREISDRYNLSVDPEAMVEDVPVGVQQRVEIIKVLVRDARYIIFDEPTAVLTPQEVEEFFGIVRGLKDDGKGVIFISHKLNEALEIADRIVVLRDGKSVGEADPKTSTREQLAEMMVGRPVDLVVHKELAVPADVVLSLRDLVVLDDRGHKTVDGVTFEVRVGEIVGIAGVQGNGQTELVESIMGMRPSLAGHVFLSGEDVTESSPRDLHRLGVAHVPEDRQESGLVLQFTVAENMVLDSYYDRPYSRGIQMDWDTAVKSSERLVDEYDVKTATVDEPVSNLSGGNQQKVIVAREFDRNVKLVVASQPTRGVDVGSIEYIHTRIVEQRDQGAAVLIVSSELDEVMALSDRVLVMFEGRIAGEFDPAIASTTEIGLAMLGSGGADV
jgi:general nucleoside transport system ATP-binding protein